MFEHSLIDLETKTQPRRRWISLPIAVGLHVAGLSAFAFGSYWTVGMVPDPDTNIGPVVMFELPSPPPGGRDSGPRPPVRQEARQSTPPPAQNRVVQPDANNIPDQPPAPSTNTTPTFEEVVPGPGTGEPGTDGPGFGDGPGGPGFGHGDGTGDGPDTGPGIGPVDTAPIHFSVGMTRPEVLHSVQPRYSELARRAGVQGTVIVEATIDQQGRVTDVRVLRGLPMNLDRAAVEAIQQWRFKPAMMGDHPVKVYYTLTVNFTIQR